MYRFLFLVVFSSLLFSQAVAQKQAREIENLDQLIAAEDSIEKLSFKMLRDTSLEIRETSCKSIIAILASSLKNKNSYYYPFSKIDHLLSILSPPDSTYRIFTWHLYISPEEYKHFGAIQMKGEGLKLFPLRDKSVNTRGIEFKTLPRDEWFGALYYKISEVDHPSGKYYVMYGFDADGYFNRRKLLDVLFFKDGEPFFGKEVFHKDLLEEVSDVERSEAAKEKRELERKKIGEEKYHRILFGYSAEVAMGLNYNERLGIIMFDHLIPSSGRYKDQGLVFVPDGSYEGYKLAKDGIWYHIDKVYNQFSVEPPRARPTTIKETKDLLGRPKKKRKGPEDQKR